MKIRIKNILLGAMALVMTNLAYAVATGLYVGGNFGQSNLHNKTQTFLTGATDDDDNLISTSATADNTGLGIRIFMGYNINPYAAWEFGFAHYASTTYGNIEYPGATVPPSGLYTNPTIHEYGFDLEGKGMYPIGPVTAFAKAGFAFVRKSTSGMLAACVPTAMNPFPCSTTTSTTNGTQANAFRPLVAIGASYDLTQNWVADLSFTRITKGSGIQNVDFFALGISYHFVDEYCGQFLC